MKIDTKKIYIVLLLSFLTVFLFSVRFSMLQKSTEPTGLDGYFYALQAKSFAQNGVLENPSHEIGYYFCGFFAKICGDAILGCKVYSALSSAFVSLGVFVLLFSLTKSLFTSLLGFFLSACSNCVTLISVNYINNQTGIFFVLFFASLLSLTSTFSTKKISLLKLIFILLLFSFCFVSHKISLIYSSVLLIFLALKFSVAFIKEKKSFFKNFSRFWKFILILSLSFVSIFFIVGLVLFFVRQSPRFLNAFALPSIPFFHKAVFNRIGEFASVEMSVIFIVSWISSIAFCIKKSIERKKICNFEFLFFNFVLFFPFWNFDFSNDIGFRLFLSAIPFGIVLILFAIFDFFKNVKFNPLSKISILIFIPLIFLTKRFYEPQKDPPYKYYKSIVQNIELPDDSLLIAHLGLNHVYTYYKNLRWSLNYIPDFEVSGGVWRLSYGANKKRIKEILLENSTKEEVEELELAIDKIQKIDNKYILVKEDLWQKYLEKEDFEISETFKNWYNPSTTRPNFIRKRKK